MLELEEHQPGKAEVVLGHLERGVERVTFARRATMRVASAASALAPR